MSSLEFNLDENQIKTAISRFYKDEFGRNVGVTLNKKKTRKNVKSRYEPVIDFSIIDAVSIGNVGNFTINTIDSVTLKNILSVYMAKKGFLVKEVVVNSNINRKLRKNNVFFENVQVLYDDEPEQEELHSAANLNEECISKLNNESIIFNSKEIYKLIQEYFRLFKHRDVEVEYVPQNSLSKGCFKVIEKNVIGMAEKENIEYITNEYLQNIMSELFGACGYKLDTLYMSNLVSSDDGIDYVSNLLRLYITATKMIYVSTLDDVNYSEELDLGSEDYFAELRTEHSEELSYRKKIKDFFGNLKRKR